MGNVIFEFLNPPAILGNYDLRHWDLTSECQSRWYYKNTASPVGLTVSTANEIRPIGELFPELHATLQLFSVNCPKLPLNPEAFMFV